MNRVRVLISGKAILWNAMENLEALRKSEQSRE